MTTSDKIRLDFLCVENAGRSQIAAALAEREREQRGLSEVVEIHSAGTKPADAIHENVAEAMAERGIDISENTPKYVVLEDLKDSHFLITMGCSISEFNPAHYGVEYRGWDITNPAKEDRETVNGVIDEIEGRVEELFDEIEEIANEQPVKKSLPDRVTSAIKRTLPF